MYRFVKCSIKLTFVAASCAAIVACGGGDETGGASSEDTLPLAATDPQEKASCPCTIWPTTAAPRAAANPETASVNLGVKFTTHVSGYVTGIRFYKGAGNDGTHVGSLWSSSGQLLARANFTGETATGWQTVTFSTPVAIEGGESYTASYLAPTGGYAIDQNYFGQSFAAPPLQATGGVYKYGTSSAFPTSQWNNSNYWVDVLFTNTAPPAPGPAPAPEPAPAPAPSGKATLDWTAPTDPAVIGYRVYYGTAKGTYMQSPGTGINAGASTSYTVNGLIAGATYYFAVTSFDSAGRESPYSNEATKNIQ
jgi:hypothetical protein